MLFFKSKKDKRIEELETLLFAMNNKAPTIVTNEKNVRTLCVKYNVTRFDDIPPMGIVKHRMAMQLSETVADNMRIDIDDGPNGSKQFVGYIKVVL